MSVTESNRESDAHCGPLFHIEPTTATDVFQCNVNNHELDCLGSLSVSKYTSQRWLSAWWIFSLACYLCHILSACYHSFSSQFNRVALACDCLRLGLADWHAGIKAVASWICVVKKGRAEPCLPPCGGEAEVGWGKQCGGQPTYFREWHAGWKTMHKGLLKVPIYSH
jgi:hypothetical protein